MSAQARGSDGIDYVASAQLVPGYAGDSRRSGRAPEGDRFAYSSFLRREKSH
jgi:hypothetical protein